MLWTRPCVIPSFQSDKFVSYRLALTMAILRMSRKESKDFFPERPSLPIARHSKPARNLSLIAVQGFIWYNFFKYLQLQPWDWFPETGGAHPMITI